MSSATITTKVKGHVTIADGKTGEVLLDKDNAVHNKNMAIAIARGLSNEPADTASGIGKHQIYRMKFGNGGSDVSSMNVITYTPQENSVTYQESPAPDTSTIVICTCTIAANEPSGQDLTDSPGDPDANSQYSFDELGLFTYDNLLLTHIIFSPILKTANRELVITYTLTISVS